MKAPENLYWDTCVFLAYLNDERHSYGVLVDHIGQFLSEAHDGRWRIYCSTITLAEISPSDMKAGGTHGFDAFLKDFSSAVVQISPDPVIMKIASELRGAGYAKGTATRKLLTPDAIHLATAISLQENFGVPLNAFHTFDRGKSKGPDGKSVPLLGYETWVPARPGHWARKAVAINREKPQHPNPQLAFSG